MTKKPKRLPTYSLDEDGQPIAVVPLARGGSATIDAHDLEELLQRGITLNWTLNLSGGDYAYVRAQTPNNLVSVARLVTGAGPGNAVKYRNGERRDLRRRNLYVTSGGRKKAR
jgi:hypothetical protein